MFDRPHTTVILAMSADGKIADKQRSPARFGSAADKAHLEAQIALADGVIFGASTLRAYGTTISITNPQLLQARKARLQTPQPVQIVVSATGNLATNLRFFRQKLPRWLLTTKQGAKFWQNLAKTSLEQAHFARIIAINTADNNSLNWLEALGELQKLGLTKLAVIGGAELVASLIAVDLIDEFWLTVCPIILGGRDAPSPVAGIGFTEERAKRLKLLEVRQLEDEVLLHYAIAR